MVKPEPTNFKILSIDIRKLAGEAIDAQAQGEDSVCHYNEKDCTLEVPYPEDFYKSTARKFVKVLNFKLINKQPERYTESYDVNGVPKIEWSYIYTAPIFYGLHADFAQDFEQLNGDNYICNSNEQFTQPLVFEQYTSKQTFKVSVWDEVDYKYVMLAEPERVIDPEERDYTKIPLMSQINLRLLLSY